MSEFLIIRSTEEQKEAGVEEPVDTASIVDRDGLPILRAVFDVHSFRPDDVQISVEDDLLTVKAEVVEDKACSTFRKTLVRRIDLPLNADKKRMQSVYTGDGLLSVEMPFHLSPRRRPSAHHLRGRCNVVPIARDAEGRRVIRLAVPLGSEFTPDDVKVDVRDRRISVTASYKAEVGEYGSEIAQKEVMKGFQLPDYVEIDSVTQQFARVGCVRLEVLLKGDETFHCEISTEDIEYSVPPLEPTFVS